MTKQEKENFLKTISEQKYIYIYRSDISAIHKKTNYCYDKFVDNDYYIYFDHEDKPITGLMICENYIAIMKEGIQHNINSPAVLSKNTYLYMYMGKVLNCNSLKGFRKELKKIVFS